MLKRSLRLAAAATIATVLLVPAVAVGSHDFIDVPDGHTFHSHISWLADNGVTKGCNPPANDEFCPDDAVTRGQMAAFMKRLSDAKVVDAATAVMADTATTADTAATADDSMLLEGMGADDLRVLTFADMEIGLGVVDLLLGDGELMTLDFEVPVAGSIVITHSASYMMATGGTAIAVGPILDTCVSTPLPMASYSEVGVGDEFDTVSGVVAYNVDAGAHTISYCGSAESENVYFINTQLGAVFQPGGVVPDLPSVSVPMDGAGSWGN